MKEAQATAHLDSAKWVSCTNRRGSGIKHLTLQKGNRGDSQGRKESLPQGLCKLMSLVPHTISVSALLANSKTLSHFHTNDGSLIQCFLDNLHTLSSWDLGVNFKRMAKHNVTYRKWASRPLLWDMLLLSLPGLDCRQHIAVFVSPKVSEAQSSLGSASNLISLVNILFYFGMLDSFRKALVFIMWLSLAFPQATYVQWRNHFRINSSF